MLSLPLWECGLKFNKAFQIATSNLVTPPVGVWIEMISEKEVFGLDLVTPLVGVWIEIALYGSGRGIQAVTPLVGVWIEIV